ncbi:sensor histidine kinase [Pectinatus frisingensis]|uniref:sensor histidine kinase n=1 Tax=Pectinatus frisingensis TaxID=865 RepID=UPI0018C5A834|nr:HAMP domain-containing sensor histidine kinase [Pectinatus frisingensis]
MKRLRMIAVIIAYVIAIGIALTGSLAVGYGMAEALFTLTGHPNRFWSSIISEVLGLIVLFVSLHLGGNHFGRMTRINTIRDALNRIAKGDFAVKIPVKQKGDRRNEYNELAKSVNKMALELSSIETMRQEFVSNVSHEIQSPLTSINGFAALLKSESLSAEQRRHYLNIIETESKRLSKLSDNLLKLSALQSGNIITNLHTFRLDKQIESILLMFEPQWMDKKITLDLLLEKLTFTGDEELLAQVWINLIHNAVKFTPNNGNINITLKTKDHSIICKIADTGIGISEADQIHIFERFFKVDKARERSLGGNGLGLSLVKKIITMHNGQINLHSTLGKGTEFIITLPQDK